MQITTTVEAYVLCKTQYVVDEKRINYTNRSNKTSIIASRDWS